MGQSSEKDANATAVDKEQAMTQVRDGTTGEQAQAAAGQAQQKVQEAAGQAKNRFAVEVDQRSTQAGEQLRSTAGDVRSVGQELRKQGKDKPAQLAERAADQVERVGGYLRESDGDRILRDAEDFGRRNPWAIAAGGVAIGFLASRFLKASSARRYQTSSVEGRAPSAGNGASAWSPQAAMPPAEPPPVPATGAPPHPPTRVAGDPPTPVPPEPPRPGAL
jgi:hypothetical protein